MSELVETVIVDHVTVKVFRDEPTPPVPPEPPVEPPKAKNHGHYLRVQGKATQADQDAYYAGVYTKLNRYIDPVILGGHVGIGWGAVDTDFTRIRDLTKWASDNGKHIIAQIQTKGFTTNPTGFECPADLQQYLHPANRGLTLNLSIPEVMDRYIEFFQRLHVEFGDNPNLEIVMPAESAPSWGGNGPDGYTTAKLATQYKRLYEAMGTTWGDQFASNLNTLGGSNNNNEIPGLMEASFQAGIMTGGPDHKRTIAFVAYEGIQTGPIPVVRKYQGLMDSVYVASQDVMGDTPGDNDQDPPEVIEDAKNHGTSYLAWIPSLSGDKSWENILLAIKAS
jgi:hypothetical protein